MRRFTIFWVSPLLSTRALSITRVLFQCRRLLILRRRRQLDGEQAVGLCADVSSFRSSGSSKPSACRRSCLRAGPKPKSEPPRGPRWGEGGTSSVWAELSENPPSNFKLDSGSVLQLGFVVLSEYLVLLGEV